MAATNLLGPAPSQVSQSLTIQELEGTNAIQVILRGGMMVEVGATFGTTVRGGKYTPIGATRATLSVTGLEYDDTEMSLAFDAQFMRVGDYAVTNYPIEKPSPEAFTKLLQTLQKRGRECNVTCASFSRRGILRNVTPTPNRGYSVDILTGKQGPTAGANVGLKLKWEWSGEGIDASPVPIPISGDEASGKLADAGARLAVSVPEDPFEPDLFSSLDSLARKMQKGIGDLRKDLKGLGDLAKAPAKALNKLEASCRALGNVTNDFHETLSSVGDEYKAANAGLGALLHAKRACGDAKAAGNAVSEALAAVFDAIASRKARLIGCRPGQSLAELAAKELGNAELGAALAEQNEITGAIVPKGVYSLSYRSG